jgi:hypothetical protein
MQLVEQIINTINSASDVDIDASGLWASVESEDYGVIEVTPDDGDVVISSGSYSFHYPVEGISNSKISKYLAEFAW